MHQTSFLSRLGSHSILFVNPAAAVPGSTDLYYQTDQVRSEEESAVFGEILYQVNDEAVFDNTSTSGSGVKATVSLIGGKTVETVSYATSSISVE